MKFLPLAAVVAALATGWFARGVFHSSSVAGPTVVAAEKGAFQCPMHPWIKEPHASRCTVCGMELVAANEAVAPAGGSASAVVMLPPGGVRAAGVKVTEVQAQRLVRTLRVSGVIDEDESSHRIFSAPVEGRIEGVAMIGEGHSVVLRQPVIRVLSATLNALADDYRRAVPKGGAELEAAKLRLLQHGLIWDQIASIPDRQPDEMHFGLLSPATGVIVKSYVSDGQYVKEGERLFEIASFKRMWFLFSASEQDLPLLQVGALVDVTTPSLPGQVIKARVSFINPVLDAASRSAQVRVVLENPDGRLRDKTYAQGAVEIELPEVLAVPRSAVLWPGGRPRVYVEQAPGVYARRGVRLGRAGDTHWEVLAGLQAGERVVTAGNMLVDSQAQWDEMSDTDIASSKPGPAAELCAAQPKP